MPTPWNSRVRSKGELAVFNQAKSWSGAVDAAIKTFNNLPFRVKLVTAKDEGSANIVVVVATGPSTYPWPGNSQLEGFTVKTKATFKPDILHGQTSTLADPRVNELAFAAVFLPGMITNVTTRQKEVVVVHEFIHASGLDGGTGGGKQDPNQDHEIVGIMNGQMKESGNGLIEYLPEKGAKAMPPIRVGPKTLCRMQQIWTDEGCEK